jgi:hypothetical protein
MFGGPCDNPPFKWNFPWLLKGSDEESPNFSYSIAVFTKKSKTKASPPLSAWSLVSFA